MRFWTLAGCTFFIVRCLLRFAAYCVPDSVPSSMKTVVGIGCEIADFMRSHLSPNGTHKNCSVECRGQRLASRTDSCHTTDIARGLMDPVDRGAHNDSELFVSLMPLRHPARPLAWPWQQVV